MATCARELSDRIFALIAGASTSVRVDGVALPAERAAFTGHPRRGRILAGRGLPTAADHRRLASGLPRPPRRPCSARRLLTGRVLSAQEALDWSLVTELVDDEQFMGRGLGLRARPAEGPSSALVQAERLIRSAWEVSGQGSQDGATTLAEAMATDEAGALVNAFAGPEELGR